MDDPADNQPKFTMEESQEMVYGRDFNITWKGTCFPDGCYLGSIFTTRGTNAESGMTTLIDDAHEGFFIYVTDESEPGEWVFYIVNEMFGDGRGEYSAAIEYGGEESSAANATSTATESSTPTSIDDDDEGYDGPGPSASTKQNVIAIVVGIAVPVMALVAIFSFIKRRRNKRRKNVKPTCEGTTPYHTKSASDITSTTAYQGSLEDDKNYQHPDQSSQTSQPVASPVFSIKRKPVNAMGTSLKPATSSHSKPNTAPAAWPSIPSGLVGNVPKISDAFAATTAWPEAASPLSLPLPAAVARDQEVQALLRRHSEVESKKQRVLELQRLENEQIEIVERIKALQRDGSADV